MTRTIMVANEKGGVGKTTIADELLFALERDGRECCFVNLDTQGGALHMPGIPDDTYDYVVIDTPGTLTRDFKKWCAGADLVLFPTRPSMRDLPALLRCWDIAGDAGCARAVVINDVKSGANLPGEFAEFCRNAGMPVAAQIPDAIDFDKAAASACSVYEVNRRGKAAEGIGELKLYVMEVLGDGSETE